MQFQLYNIINESVNHSSQYISVNDKKNLRKSQAHFREMVRKLSLKQNNDFLIKRQCVDPMIGRFDIIILTNFAKNL